MGLCRPTTGEGACSGRCKKNTRCAAPRLFVAAACGGLISLFEKEHDGHLSLMPLGEGASASSFDVFQAQLEVVEAQSRLQQLVVVGSSNDISWMQMSLPPHIAKHVVAEIEYPLVAGWFRQDPPSGLAHALEHLLQS